jgi:type VI secretion system secreted protein VgrG
MFNPVNERSFRLDVAGLHHPLEVLSFSGREAISEPFVFDVELRADDPALDLASLLYRSAFLNFGSAGNGIHGQLHELVRQEHGSSPWCCRVRLGPRLGCLSQRYSQRMFSARSVPQILTQVLREHGIADEDRRFELSGDYPLRDFCTQYQESDLQFLQRLCAEAGLHYYFEHRPRGHCLVFGDAQGRFPLGGREMFQAAGEQPAVRQFGREEGEALQSDAYGRTDVMTLRSGQLMQLCGHPIAQWNQLWLLTRIEHQWSRERLTPYSNQIHAVDCEQPLVLPRPTVKPRMHSLQRAWVVDVDEVQPDASRSVAVQFDWLYQGEGATPSHCWLPLAEDLCPSSATQLPEGAEVVVSFIEGDPDQPVIAGFLQAPATAEHALEPEPEQDARTVEDLAPWLASGEPLILLCLLPGGGSFHHCAQTLCTCRVAIGPGRSDAA